MAAHRPVAALVTAVLVVTSMAFGAAPGDAGGAVRRAGDDARPRAAAEPGRPGRGRARGPAVRGPRGGPRPGGPARGRPAGRREPVATRCRSRAGGPASSRTCALAYDSGGGNGWVGTGWDLSLGAVEVDTRWGVAADVPGRRRAVRARRGPATSRARPICSTATSSPPTAVRSPFQPRVAERADWTRRTETEWERIVRHGDSPKTYWWEVTDKTGTTRYYGARPGPGSATPGAIVTSADGDVRWGLTAVIDISSNTMTVSLRRARRHRRRRATARRVGTGSYVREITYTGSHEGRGQPRVQGAVPARHRPGRHRCRPPAPTSSWTPPPARWRSPPTCCAGSRSCTAAQRPTRRATGRSAATGGRSWSRAGTSSTTTGPFDKSLLTRVDQVGGDRRRRGQPHLRLLRRGRATPAGDVRRLRPQRRPGRPAGGGNDLSQSLLSPVGLSALGASENNSGGGARVLRVQPHQPDQDRARSAGRSRSTAAPATASSR